MSALVAFVAELLKLPPAVVGAGLIILSVLSLVMLVALTTRYVSPHVFRYLERRGEDNLIARHIEKSPEPKPAVIHAIRGTAIADSAQVTSAAAPAANEVDAEVEGAVKRATGWLRDLKLLPPGG